MVSVLASAPPGQETRPARRDQSDILVLDAQTFKDLEIFDADVEGTSLFDLCNYTRNEKGARALRRRMENPWSDSSRICAVQESITFITTNRKAFNKLPTFATTEAVERYFHGNLPLVLNRNSIEFFFNAFELHYGDFVRYHMIERGVEVTSNLIHALLHIVNAPELAEPQGELAPLLNEMRTLLAHPLFARVSKEKAWSLSFWKILRTDQIFRIYEKETVDRLLKLTYEVDALISMADATRKHGFILPQISEDSLAVQAEELVHPLVASAIANPVTLDQSRRLLFLTGPNMAGKTTYLRACAIGLYLAHLGMGVPARSFRFAPAQRLFSSITLADNLRIGVSYFRAEALRVKAIAQAVADGYRVIAVMDEPFKGTNVKDALDASRAILERFADKSGNLFMFSSHLIELSEQMHANPQVDCQHFKAGEHEGRLRFDYVLCPGVSNQRLGMRVLEEEGIFELLDGGGVE